MRHIHRYDKPEILKRKQAIWTSDFVLSTKTRPDTSKYRHKEILADLLTMSGQKCFYCEKLLKGKANEVDHHIEVSINKSLAFEWTNLYLACDNCNDKLDHRKIPIAEALDPCRDNDEEISEHIYFKNEMIVAKDNSSKGNKTIKKYRLDSLYAEFLRMRELQKFADKYDEITVKCANEERVLCKDDIETLKDFTHDNSSFSKMFKDKFKRLDESLEK